MSRRSPTSARACGETRTPACSDEPDCIGNHHWHAFTPAGLAALARRFKQQRAPNHRREMRYHRRQDSWAEALRVAALCIAEDGKLHDHQRRLGHARVAAAYMKLRSLKPREGEDFHGLYQRICSRLKDEPGLGPLYRYDVAQRLGAFLRTPPKFVYLHAGTRTGVRAFGLPAGGEYLTKQELPRELRVLTPALLEDFFCMKKDCLRDTMLRATRPHPRKSR